MQPEVSSEEIHTILEERKKKFSKDNILCELRMGRYVTKSNKFLGKTNKQNVYLHFLEKLCLLALTGSIAVAAAKSLQPCPTLCSTMDGIPQDSLVHRTLQARTLEWVAISFSSGFH